MLGRLATHGNTILPQNVALAQAASSAQEEACGQKPAAMPRQRSAQLEGPLRWVATQRTCMHNIKALGIRTIVLYI